MPGSPWACARAYEALAALCVMEDDTEAAARYTDQAAQLFRVNGTADKAMRLYLEKGRVMEDRGLFELAARFYAQALHIVTEEQLTHYSRDAVSPYVSLLLDNQLYYDAIAVYEKELAMAKQSGRQHYVNKVRVIRRRCVSRQHNCCLTGGWRRRSCKIFAQRSESLW